MPQIDSGRISIIAQRLNAVLTTTRKQGPIQTDITEGQVQNLLGAVRKAAQNGGELPQPALDGIIRIYLHLPQDEFLKGELDVLKRHREFSLAYHSADGLRRRAKQFAQQAVQVSGERLRTNIETLRALNALENLKARRENEKAAILHAAQYRTPSSALNRLLSHLFQDHQVLNEVVRKTFGEVFSQELLTSDRPSLNLYVDNLIDNVEQNEFKDKFARELFKALLRVAPGWKRSIQAVAKAWGIELKQADDTVQARAILNLKPYDHLRTIAKGPINPDALIHAAEFCGDTTSKLALEAYLKADGPVQAEFLRALLNETSGLQEDPARFASLYAAEVNATLNIEHSVEEITRKTFPPTRDGKLNRQPEVVTLKR